MADAILMSGGTGSIASDDVTAKQEDVLEGKTTVTADSNDEVVAGTMQLLKTELDIEHSRMAHHRGDWFGQGRAVDSATFGRGIVVSIKIPDSKRYALDTDVEFVFKPEPHLQPGNIRAGAEVAGVSGGIPEWSVAAHGGIGDTLYAWNKEGYVRDIAGKRGILVRIPDGHIIKSATWVFLEVPELVPNNIRGGKMITDMPGGIPEWSPTNAGVDDVLYAWNDDGMVFDLRTGFHGILTRIPDNHIITKANWVFLKSPNLLPHNVRAGTNINGCVGTLVDYGAGGTVFNGATFDNKFCSGVANSVFKGIQCRNITILQGSLQRNAAGGTKRGIFHGIADGGLKIQIYASTKNLPAFPYVGCALDKSINLTPFSKIRVGYFFRDVDYRVAEYNGNVSVSVAVTVVPTVNYSDTSTEGFRVRGYASNAVYNRRLHNATFNSGFNQSDFVQQYFELDVSASQGHHFVLIGADSDVSHNTCYISAAFVINHIELIN